MKYIESSKEDGATGHLGGDWFGNEVDLINTIIFTATRPDMEIVKDEISGPVGVVTKFNDDEGLFSFPRASCGG
jgi:aldehyde dehydrogenase (NAD+)